MSEIIAVMGGSGTGKTTFTANLACGLAEKNKVVIILSGELSFGTIQTFFNETIPADKGIMASLTNIYEPAQNYLAQCSKVNKNIYIMGTPNSRDDIFIDTIENSKAKTLIKTLTGFADYLIIDAAASLLNDFTILGVSYARYLFCLYRASTNAALWRKSVKHKIEELSSGTIYPVIAQYNRGCNEQEFMKIANIPEAYFLPEVEAASVLENIGTPIYYADKKSAGQNKKQLKEYKKFIDNIVTEIVTNGGVM